MEFINTIFTFPTVVFSTLLLVVLLFWIIALLGFADIESFDTDVDTDISSAGGSSAWQVAFGGVPISISVSFIILLAWTASIYIHQFFAYLLGNGVMFYLMGSVFIVASLVAALPLTALLIRPLRRFFNNQEATSKSSLVGLECVIATSKITANFGQARVFINGTEQLVEVRNDEDNEFTLGDTALLIEFDSQQHCYTVVAKPW
ncbi:DUF1449 domain-containing protein [Pseudoalteromonas sp. T1lg65]|uniref:DUF1449 domain-containing protein n=1 Tax=Pseudoalteromonas sp. T1lg65 TaxID=2077101 RepID=UPI003F7AFB06